MKPLMNKIALFLAVSLSSQGLLAQSNKISLKDAADLVVVKNKTLAVQKLEEQRYQEISKEIRGKLLPSLAINGTAAHYFDRQVIFLPGTMAGTLKPVQDVRVGGLNALNSSITLQQPIISKNVSRLKEVARMNENIQSEMTNDLKNQLVFQVTKDYYGIQLLKNQLEVQEKSLSRNQKALVDAKSMFYEGRALSIDTLKSYIAVENLRSSIAYLNNNIEVVTSRFKKLIGIDDATVIELSDQLVLEDELIKFASLQQKVTMASTERNDIRLQEMNIEREERKLSSVKANKLPMVSLIGQYQLQAQMDDAKVANYNLAKTSFIGLQLSLPVFSGGTYNAQARQSKIQIEQEKLNLEELKEEVSLELTAIAINWKNAETQLQIQKRTVEAAEMNYSINKNRYLNNLSSMLEVNDAELALNTAQLNYLMAVYELKVLTVTFEKALGLFR